MRLMAVMSRMLSYGTAVGGDSRSDKYENYGYVTNETTVGWTAAAARDRKKHIEQGNNGGIECE